MLVLTTDVEDHFEQICSNISIGILESDLLSQSTPCGTKWTLA